jgi:hypothetical protein
MKKGPTSSIRQDDLVEEVPDARVVRLLGTHMANALIGRC